MKPTDISQLIADLRNYQTTLDENVVICDRRAVDGSAEIMLALAAHIAMMEDRICTHPPAPDATRGDPVARVVEWLRKENYRAFTDGMEAAAQICGSLAEVEYDDADGFDAATGCEAAIMRVVKDQRREQAALGASHDADA